MARYTGPAYKISRRLGFSTLENGKELARRPYAPGQHGTDRRKKSSEYGIQLQEKQCIPSTINQEITPDDKYVLSKVTVAGDENLKPENIKKDIEIFGITGELISLPLREKIFKLSGLYQIMPKIS